MGPQLTLLVEIVRIIGVVRRVRRVRRVESVGRGETVIASVSVAIQPFRDKRLEKRDKGIVLVLKLSNISNNSLAFKQFSFLTPNS